MNNKKISETLALMKGKTFQYGNNIHYVIDYKIEEKKERCTIQTNVTSFDRTFEALEEFLRYWKPVENIAALQTVADQQQQIALFMEQENSLSNKLIDMLTDNITKVQNNKDYIPQAQSINNNINTIVNIAKMRLTLISQFKSSVKSKQL